MHAIRDVFWLVRRADIRRSLAVASLLATVCLEQSASLAQSETAAPEFILIGTTRIGSRVSALLQLRDGGKVKVVTRAGEPTPIEGFEAFTVTRIDATSVDIEHPADAPCVAYPGLGVGCRQETVTELMLVSQVLDRVNNSASWQGTKFEDNSLEQIPAAEGSFIDRIQQKAEARGERPEVPPGMQLISTSTGYRLVPDD